MKVSCYNVYENKSIVLHSFEEKQKYHVTYVLVYGIQRQYSRL